jgi:biopolymer transport protein ExbD
LAVTSNAVAVPNADQPDALVVALTADGSTYLAANRVPTPDLADRVKSILSTRKDKTLYIKADARVQGWACLAAVPADIGPNHGCGPGEAWNG